MAGLATLIGGLAWIVAALLYLATPVSADANEVNTLQSILSIVGILGFLAGLFALKSSGALGDNSIGRTGLWVAAVGLIAILAAAVLAFVPNLEVDDMLWPIGGLITLVGFVMVGMATMQTRVLSQWPALPIAIGIAMFLVVAAYTTLFFLSADVANWLIIVTTALAGILWALLGYTLWSWASRPSTATR
jgi:hypothetical protein